MISSPRSLWLGAALLAGVALLAVFGGRLPLGLAVGLWMLLGLGGLRLLGGGRVGLFGPVVMRELVRTARRGQLIWPRCVYLFVILVLLALVADQAGLRRWRPARLAEEFFLTFALAQFWAVLVLTPAVVAGAIAEEKERGRLDFLLTADLADHEIVLGKLTARLANLALFLLAGLPVLSVLQFLGGIDPQLLLFVFAITALTMLGVGGVSILCSTLCARTRDATLAAYLVVIAYLTLSFLSAPLLNSLYAYSALPDEALPVLATVAEWIDIGNPSLIPGRLQEAAVRGQLAEALPEVLARYALFHGVLAAGCVGWASLRLRMVGQRSREGRRKPGRSAVPVRALGDGSPMFWKEIALDRRRRGWRAVVLIGLLILASLVPAVGMILANPGRVLRGQSEGFYTWACATGAVVATLGWLAVGVRAAGSITGEREKGTLDGLLASPLTVNDILLSKWLGSIVGAMRWVLPWLALIWGVAYLTGAMHWLAIVALVELWFVYAAVFASIGLHFSVSSSSTLRATVGTLLLPFGLLCCGWPPPVVFIVFASLGAPGHFKDLGVVGGVSVGLWMILGLGFWFQARLYFCHKYGRRWRESEGLPRRRGAS